MKILFWNIGGELDNKFNAIQNVINKSSADIVCIAEGSYSRDDCKKLDAYFDSINFYCYYSPLFADNSINKLDYKFGTGLGLKLYIKDKNWLVETFHIGLQREEGRIVSMTIEKSNKRYALVFLHNYSKKGDRETVNRQSSFITRLSDMLRFWYVKEAHELLLIMGDFNLEPWDTILREKNLINNFFITKHWNLFQRGNENKYSYFNPLLEKIISEPNPNLGGTFYKSEFGWALLDYVLIDRGTEKISFNIITDNLLETDVSIKNNLIKNEFDHLPILTEINN